MRGGNRLRESTLNKPGLNPVWRGVGCITLVVFALGGYWLSGLLIQAYKAGKIPSVPVIPLPSFAVPLGPWKVPVSGVVIPAIPLNIDVTQILFTIVVVLIGYALVTIMWSLANPVRLGPTDAPPIHRKIDKSKVR